MRLKSALLIAAVACAIPAFACAATPSDTLRAGTVTDTVHSLSDSAETYALYLPSAGQLNAGLLPAGVRR